MDINASNSNHRSRVAYHGDNINIFDYWSVIKKYRKMIGIIVLVASITAVVTSLLLPKRYRADAVIIPVSSKGSSNSMGSLASQFGGLASLAGVNMSGSGVGDTEKILAILRSRTLAENVINTENLMPILFEKAWDDKAKKWKITDPEKQPNMEDAVRKMKSSVQLTDDKKAKTIKISGSFQTPQIASDVVNSYLSELQKFIANNAFTTAKRNRIFIEGQLQENKRDLLEAGKMINDFYKENRISSADARIDVPIASKQLTANSDRTMPDDPKNNEDIVTAQGSQLTAYDNPDVATDAGNQLGALISTKEDVEKKMIEAKTVQNVPQQVYLSYVMLRRELLGKVNALLTSQYEMAKIEESKEDLAFQVIDKAVPPIKRYFPKRSQICIMSFMAALFFAVFLAFFRDYIERMWSVTRNK